MILHFEVGFRRGKFIEDFRCNATVHIQVKLSSPKMKTHIIHLDQHDDYASASDQLTWAKSQRILLVFPKKGRVLRNKLDLILINRKANQLGAKLGIVCKDEDLCALADENHIPVFDSVSKAQKGEWIEGSPVKNQKFDLRHSNKRLTELIRVQQVNHRSRLENNWAKVAVFSLAILSSLMLMAVFILSAEIILPIRTHTLNIKATLFADPNIKSASITGGVPVDAVQVIVEGKSEIPCTGSVLVGENTAVGSVTVIKMDPMPLTIPEGTLFLTVGEPLVKFESTRAVNLIEGTGINVEVPIKAMESGVRGNVDEGSILAVEGELGTRIYVNNDEPTSGGTDMTSPSPAEVDYVNLRNKLIGELKQLAIKQLENDTQVEDVFPVRINFINVVSENSSPDRNIPSDILSMTMTAEYEIWLVKKADLNSVASMIIQANVPEGYVPAKIDPQITLLTEPLSHQSSGTVRWDVECVQQYSSHWTRDEIAHWAAGKKITDVYGWLEDTFDLSESPQIKIDPFSLGFMPLIPFRIDVRTNDAHQ